MKAEQKATCPSAAPREGAVLLGIVKRNGDVGLLGERMEIDHDFIQTAQEGRELEQRFRFASPCITKGCANWSGEHCMVLDIARKLAQVQPENTGQLPACSIRPTCRWYMQEGARACHLCPKIITGYAALERPSL